MRASAFHPPRTTPFLEMTISAYRLHVGVNRQRRPMRAAAGDRSRW
jgi:hypothetical protein